MSMQDSFRNKPIVWTISGSDCSGLAGQVADTRAIEALGAHPCMVTTAVTAQNSEQVIAIQALSKEQIQAQFSALTQGLNAKSIKIGLLPTLEVIETVLDYIKNYAGQVVLDPVLVSSSGKRLMSIDAQQKFLELLPYVDLLTPNIPELESLTGSKVKTPTDIENLSTQLLKFGCKAVLLKGGHSDSEYCSDYFVSNNNYFWLHNQRQAQTNTRGTGCVLAAAIATVIAQDYSIEDAVVIGKMLINQAIRNGYKIGQSKGPLRPNHWPNQQQDMPSLTKNADWPKTNFASCGKEPLGLYPVVDRALWLERLLPQGITTIQLRVKDLSGESLEQEIIAAIKIAEKYKARLFINDYWQLAIKHQAYGVHLGQEDLDSADLGAIAKAGLCLGLSTHCYYEVARAHAIQPSYLACGPVYHTESKQMPWIPHGIPNLSYWLETMDNYPWVAIGGINLERLEAVAQTGVSGIAMISAITQSENPEQVTLKMIEQIKRK